MVFAQVGLHKTLWMFCHQGAGHLKLIWCRGDGKTGRDGVMRTAFAVPFFQQTLAVVIACNRGICQPVRCIAVHHDLTADHAHIAARGFGEIGINGRRVYRTIGHRRGGAVTKQKIIEMPRHQGAVIRVSKACLFRESIVVQPVQKLVAPGGDDLHLRKVDVGVDETGHQKMRTVIRDRGTWCLRGDSVKTAGRKDAAVFDQNGPILDIGIGFCVLFVLWLCMKVEHTSA